MGFSRIKVYVLLANIFGDNFIIDESDVRCVFDKDLAFIPIRTNDQGTKYKSLRRIKGSYHESYFRDLKVYNLGFPDGFQANTHFKILKIGNSIKGVFDKGVCIQEGSIVKAACVWNKAKDVNLKNARSFIVNYTSEQGFSGGPLFESQNGNVIGMMSMVVPGEDNRAPTQCVAIRLDEILAELKKAFSGQGR